MTEIRVAVLGASGWMGKIRTMAWQTIPHVFGTPSAQARIVALVAHDPAAADPAGRAPGARILQDWQQVVAGPAVDLIDICLPNSLHYPLAKAALLAGKHVHCEKPLADTAAEARDRADNARADNARAKGLITRLGHAFPRNPVHDLVRHIVQSGEIGEVRPFKGCRHIDTFGDPLAPFMWRADGKLAPTGIVADTGSHVFSVMEFLVGRVFSLIADNLIVTARRPDGDGASIEVTNPEATNLLCRFENGASGIVDFSRVAIGRKFRQTFEISGTKGSLTFDDDQENRLHVYTNEDRDGRKGYRAIDVGPENANYRACLPLPNVALGYDETKIIEADDVPQSVATGQPMWPTFDVGHFICQIIDACMQSSKDRRWVDIPLV